ncbi:MAG: TorF family putative porin [Betaproteobacteria bacterium]|nr:TorF family putative porin [Betaproteobacteria bacterium]
MRKTFIATAVLAALAASSSVMAEEPAAAAPAASEHTFTANVGLVSDYRFRGISQTFGKPAVQGGFDYSHASGFYLGNWNSNVSETAGYPDGNLEMDFYGGYKQTIGDWGYDVGLLEYYYPGSHASLLGAANPHSTATSSGTVHNSEVYLAGSWKFVTLKYSHAFSDYFSIPDTKGSHYLDLSANYDLGDGWGVNGHAGHTSVKSFGEASYSDYKLGVTKDVGGFVFGASYITTNAKDKAGEFYRFTNHNGNTYAGGKDTVVLSVSRTF